ncbi:hypothetical protein ACFLYO_02040 [Chloroflexota bacterium]
MFRLLDGRMMQFNRERGTLWRVSEQGPDNQVRRQALIPIDNLDEFIAGLLAQTLTEHVHAQPPGVGA